MVFTSEVFLLAFLPIGLLGFGLAALAGSRTSAIAWLVAASLFFYGWWNWTHLFLLAASIGTNYLFGQALTNNRSKILLGLGVTFNLLLLGYFKYANFVLDTSSNLLGAPNVVLDIALPLAISFYTFQQIVYLVDIYRGQPSDPSFLQYSLFVVFFPHAIAGPILHHRDIIPQFQSRDFPRLEMRNLLVGFVIFVIGFDKKVFIADSMALIANPVFDSAITHPPGLAAAWAGALAYTFQLYFDFSGYSDMAIGLARMFGVALPLNFHSPYKAESIIDFWRRWHMTLSRFLRDYLYIPLGGNRKGPVRRHANILIVMLLGGLWHGAGWNFVIWGGLHGVLILLNHGWRALRGDRVDLPALWARAASRLATFIAVVIAWVFFRAADWASAYSIIRGLVGLNDAAVIGGVTLESAFWLAAILAVVWFAPNTQELMAPYKPAFDYPAAGTTSFRAAPKPSAFVGRLWPWFESTKVYILVPLISGSVVMAILVSLSRGTISNQFIYMIF